MGNIVHVEDSNFEEKVFQCSKVALVDFWAPWCGPCRMVGGVIEELAPEVDNVEFFKVNIDESQEYAAKFGVRNIPTLLLFKNGELVAKQIGALSKEDLKKFINQ